MKFSGKNVLITGASRGIGAAAAKVLGRMGVKVWINYNSSEDQAVALKQKIAAESDDAAVEVIKFDVADEEAFSDAIQHIVAIDGTLSYLVNNAGITRDGFSLMMETSEYDEVMDVNARSCFIGSREAFKVMARNKFGAIVNISSITAEMGNAGQVNYASSKGAILAMTKSFALEGAPRNIRFNALTPGLIATDMTSVLDKETHENFIRQIPLKRFGEAEEVGYAVAFLLSDYASYMTGEVMKVNGGLYL